MLNGGNESLKCVVSKFNFVITKFAISTKMKVVSQNSEAYKL